MSADYPTSTPPEASLTRIPDRQLLPPPPIPHNSFSSLIFSASQDSESDSSEAVSGQITNDSFAQLVNLSKKITDYVAEDDMQAYPDPERKDAEIDDELDASSQG
jgi:hypothetical protein